MDLDKAAEMIMRNDGHTQLFGEDPVSMGPGGMPHHMGFNSYDVGPGGRGRAGLGLCLAKCGRERKCPGLGSGLAR